jgi:hypothetical protein
MKRTILPVLALSVFTFTAAGAVPAPRTEQPASTDLILEVKSKAKVHGGKVKVRGGKYPGHYKYHHKHGGKYAGKYYYGNRNWTYRYRYRPVGWELYGCIAAGPFWYCP